MTLLYASLLLLAVVMLANLVTAFSFVKFLVTSHGTSVELVENGAPTWYSFSLGAAHRVAGAPGFENAPVTVLEALPYGTEGAYAVLAQAAGVDGTMVGILHANNTFEYASTDASVKADLAVRPDGMALYAAKIEGESRIMVLDLTKSGTAPTNLVRGRSPRVFTDGFFIAITDKGIARIDPVSKDVAVLVPTADADLLNGSISPDGLTVSLSNTSGKTLLYTVQHTSPGDVSLSATARFIALSPVSFIGTEFIVERSASSMDVYERAPIFRKVGSLRIK